MNDNPMYEKYVETSWCPADVKAIRENWSDEKCMEALNTISRWLEDRLIESGWEILETLIDLEYGYEDESEDEDA